MVYRGIRYVLLVQGEIAIALAWIGPHVVTREGPAADHVEVAIRALIDWALA